VLSGLLLLFTTGTGAVEIEEALKDALQEILDVIEAAFDEVWWVDPSDAGLHHLVVRLAPLMRHQTIGLRPWMELNLKDLTMIKEKIDLGGDLGRISIAGYRERIESFIRDLVDENPVLRKLQRGEELSRDEFHELAELLESSKLQVTEERLQQIYDNRTAHFLQLIRHVLGLEYVASWEETVSERFDAFIAAHTDLSSRQILFLRTLRTFILQRRHLEKRDLVDEPFTRLRPSGV